MKETLDFVVIGAQKAGTTSLFEYLRRHPEVSLPAAKEMPFFDDEAGRFRDWGDYLRKAFSSADPGSKWGTATPQYMVGGLLEQPNPAPDGTIHDERTIPSRIRRRAHDARLIAILRDPVERACSHHRMLAMEGVERRPFDVAIDELLSPGGLEDSRMRPRETTGYVAWGEYGRILAGYFDVFPAEQILVLFTEELQDSPREVLKRVFRFLGVDDDFVPANLGARYRVGGERRRFSWLGTYSTLSPLALQRRLTSNRLAKQLWHELPEPRRRQVDRIFGRFVYRLDLWNRQSTAEPVDPHAETTERLRAHFAADEDRLAGLIGTAPPWRASAGVG